MSAPIGEAHNVGSVGVNGDEIRARRIALQMTVKALADKAGVDRGQLSKIEAGSKARDSTLAAIDKALRVAEDAQKPAVMPQIVTFRLAGEGVNVTVEGPIDNIAELEASVRRLVQQIGQDTDLER